MAWLNLDHVHNQTMHNYKHMHTHNRTYSEFGSYKKVGVSGDTPTYCLLMFKFVMRRNRPQVAIRVRA